MRDSAIRRGAAQIWEGETVTPRGQPGVPGAVIAGMVLDSILRPAELDSGELPVRGIRMPSIPVPAPDLNVPLPPLAEPPVPELQRPPVPDVVVVQPAAPIPAPQAPKVVPPLLSTPRPARVRWPWLAAAAPILRPILRGATRGAERWLEKELPKLLTEPAPRMRFTDPLPNVVDTTPGGLTAPTTGPVPSPSPAPLRLLDTPQQTTEDERCRCKKERKHEADPSDTIADVKTYKRRMSNWSLKNLNRGSKAAKTLRRFLP